MRIDLPEELSAYTRETSAESKALAVSRLFGVLVLVGLIGTPVSFFLGRPDLGILCLALGFASAVGLIIKQNKRHSRKCPRCHKPMDVLDVGWSSETYTGAKRKYPGVIMGADGSVYYARSRRSTVGGSGGSVVYTIEQFMQRWCACHNCKVCFLSDEIAREEDEMYKTQKSKKWRQAQELIQSDPDAVSEGKIFKL